MTGNSKRTEETNASRILESGYQLDELSEQAGSRFSAVAGNVSSIQRTLGLLADRAAAGKIGGQTEGRLVNYFLPELIKLVRFYIKIIPLHGDPEFAAASKEIEEAIRSTDAALKEMYVQSFDGQMMDAASEAEAVNYKLKGRLQGFYPLQSDAVE